MSGSRVAGAVIGVMLLAASTFWSPRPDAERSGGESSPVNVVHGAAVNPFGRRSDPRHVASATGLVMQADDRGSTAASLETLTQPQLRMRLTAEARDEVWASSAEAALQAEVARLRFARATVAPAIMCRTTLCEVVVRPAREWSGVEYDMALAELQDGEMNARLAASGLIGDRPIIFETGGGPGAMPIAVTRYVARDRPGGEPLR